MHDNQWTWFSSKTHVKNAFLKGTHMRVMCSKRPTFTKAIINHHEHLCVDAYCEKSYTNPLELISIEIHEALFQRCCDVWRNKCFHILFLTLGQCFGPLPVTQYEWTTASPNIIMLKLQPDLKKNCVENRKAPNALNFKVRGFSADPFVSEFHIIFECI